MNSFLRQSWAGVKIMLAFMVVLGVAYPVAIWGIGQVTMHSQANGSTITASGPGGKETVVGSKLIGQNFTGDRWFAGRPSAAGDGYDTGSSGASNLGPNEPDLLKAVNERRAAVAKAENVDPADVPPDAVTASGSGLDPDISVAYALIQVPRVAAANKLSPDAVRALVTANTEGPTFGFLGAKGVNVLELNLAVQRRSSEQGSR